MGRQGTVIKSVNELNSFFHLTKGNSEVNQENNAHLQGGSWIVRLKPVILDDKNETGTLQSESNTARERLVTRKVKIRSNCLLSKISGQSTSDCNQKAKVRKMSIPVLQFLARNTVGHDLDEEKVLQQNKSGSHPSALLCDQHWTMIESGMQLEQLIRDLNSQLKVIKQGLSGLVEEEQELVKVKQETMSESEEEMVDCHFSDWNESETDMDSIDPMLLNDPAGLKVPNLHQVDLDFCEINPACKEESDANCSINSSGNLKDEKTKRTRPSRAVKSKYQRRRTPAPKSIQVSKRDFEDNADSSCEVPSENNSDSENSHFDAEEEVNRSHGEEDDKEPESMDEEFSKPKRKRRKKERKSDRDYKDRLICLVCDTKFETIEDKTKHCLETYGKAPNLHCPICQADSPNLRALMEHYKKQHTVPVSQFPCRNCPEAFIISRDRYKHEWRCKKGPPRSSSNKILVKAPYQRKSCPVCWKHFSSSAKKLEHVKSYGEPPNVRCPACNQVSRSFANMSEHFQRAHSVSIFQYVCRQNCSEAFHASSQRKKHEQHCSTGIVECPICKKKYMSVNFLRIHVDRYHNPDKDPKDYAKKQFCELCGKLYTSISDLKLHQKKVHFKTHKKVECEHCGKQLSDMRSLKKHTQSQHMKSFQFKCEICGSESLFKSHLAAHMKSSHKELSEEDIEELLATCEKVRDNTHYIKKADAVPVSLDAVMRKKTKKESE